MSENIPDGWIKAAGSCGYNVAGPVYGRYLRGHALFAWQSSPDFWSAVAVGLGSCGGKTFAQAAANAEKEANENCAFIGRLPCGSWGDADRRLTRKQFDELINNP